jgi:hypothetical protein
MQKINPRNLLTIDHDAIAARSIAPTARSRDTTINELAFPARTRQATLSETDP